jgi:phosphatidylglycerophosphate synthase
MPAGRRASALIHPPEALPRARRPAAPGHRPALDRLGKALAARGVPADAVTLGGLAAGLAAAVAIAFGQFGLALALVLVSRLAEGLHGAVARASRQTDFGRFLDITADFVFYAAVPLALVLHDPAANGVAGAALLAATSTARTSSASRSSPRSGG